MNEPSEPNGESNNQEHELVNVSIPTAKKAQKRKFIKTKFADEDDTVLEAQRMEKERLERQKKKNNEADHIKQLEELYAASSSTSKLPELTLKNEDFGDDDFWDQAGDGDFECGIEDALEQQPCTSKGRKSDQNKNVEVIDVSSDDEEDVKEMVARRVPPPRMYPIIRPRLTYESYASPGRRPRLYYTDKELADQNQMEQQYATEERRRKKMRSLGDLENTETLGGRLLVNSGHPDNDPDVFVAPHLTHTLQPHQLGGIRFMYDNAIESLDDFKNTEGFGCILAHSMGLGKTIQVITFTEIFLRVTKAKKVLIIMPINTIQNWFNEFDKWMPKYSTSGEHIRQFEVFIIGDTVKSFDQRVKVLEDWDTRGGVLLLGYDMFRILIRLTAPKKKAKRPTLNLNGVSNPNRTGDEPEQEQQQKENEPEFTSGGRVKSEAMQTIRNSLLDPGPDLVVCDEGHKIKNLNTDISMSLSSIRTRRRIVLTGYPLQNNLMEYYCMVDFVRPKYLGEKKSFIDRFERPIKNGQCVDSTAADIRLAQQRTHVLVERVKGFVQRRTHHLLKSILPDSKEYVLLLRKSNIQRLLYRSFVIYANHEMKAGTSNTFNPLKAFAACSKIWNHPDILKDMFLKIEEEKSKRDRIKSEASSSSETYQSSMEMMNSPFGGYVSSQQMMTSQISYAVNSNALSQMAQMKPPYAQDPTSFQYQRQQSQYGYTQQMYPPNGYSAQQPQHQHQQYYAQNSYHPQQMGSGPVGMFGYNGLPSYDNPFQNNGNGIKPKEEVADMFDVKPSSSNTSSDEKKPEDPKKKKRQTKTANNGGDEDDLADTPEAGIKYDWAEEIMRNYTTGSIEQGYKVAITFDIINECTKLNEKILIFSQNLKVLSLLEDYMDTRTVCRNDGQLERWEKNKNYLRFDGSTNGTDRERLINKFNNNQDCRLFLISTKAGSLGVNLVSANRCIIFDACWNPCHDAQAVCRVYRYGQQKKTYIYRLVMDNSMERAIFNRQISKHGLQQRVVDDAQVDANVTQRELETLLIYDEAKDVVHDKWDTSTFELEDEVLRKVVEKDNVMLAAPPFLHESLITEREEGLSEEEKREAVLLFEREKMAEMNAGLEEEEDDVRFGPVSYGMRRNWGRPQTGLPFTTGLAPPLKSTPMPATMMYNPSAKRTIGGTTMSTGVMHMRSLGAFPGAATAKPTYGNSSGTTQQITTDREFTLPLAGNMASSVTIPAGSAVEIIRPNHSGIYLRLADKRVLDATNTVFNRFRTEPAARDDPRAPYIMRQTAPVVRRKLEPTRPFIPIQKKDPATDPEVIEID